MWKQIQYRQYSSVSNPFTSLHLTSTVTKQTNSPRFVHFFTITSTLPSSLVLAVRFFWEEDQTQQRAEQASFSSVKGQNNPTSLPSKYPIPTGKQLLLLPPPSLLSLAQSEGPFLPWCLCSWGRLHSRINKFCTAVCIAVACGLQKGLFLSHARQDPVVVVKGWSVSDLLAM